MPGRYVIELEPEVRDWLETLTLKEYAKVEAMADILADHAETLGEKRSARRAGGVADRVPQDPAGRTRRGRASGRSAAGLRIRA